MMMSSSSPRSSPPLQTRCQDDSSQSWSCTARVSAAEQSISVSGNSWRRKRRSNSRALVQPSFILQQLLPLLLLLSQLPLPTQAQTTTLVDITADTPPPNLVNLTCSPLTMEFIGNDTQPAGFSQIDDCAYVEGDNNILNGQAGNDQILVVGHDNIVRGQAGVDVLLVEGDGNTLQGLLGNDYLQAVGDNNTLLGDSGPDTLVVWGNDNLLQGDNGVNLLQVWSGSGNTVLGGTGPDTIVLWPGSETTQVEGQEGTDTIVLVQPGSGNVIHGGGGNDVITVYGGAGNTIDGQSDADTIVVDNATTTSIRGGFGPDTLIVNGGSDNIVRGDRGRDRLVFSGRNHTLQGGFQQDVFVPAATDFDAATFDDTAPSVILDFGFWGPESGVTGVETLDWELLTCAPGFTGLLQMVQDDNDNGQPPQARVQVTSQADPCVVRTLVLLPNFVATKNNYQFDNVDEDCLTELELDSTFQTRCVTNAPTTSAGPTASQSPSVGPTGAPTTRGPTGSPITDPPSLGPTTSPTAQPTATPSQSPTPQPTTTMPTFGPFVTSTPPPTPVPTRQPTLTPSMAPTALPTASPATITTPSEPSSLSPTSSPAETTSNDPPTISPTVSPVLVQVNQADPTAAPTASPTASLETTVVLPSLSFQFDLSPGTSVDTVEFQDFVQSFVEDTLLASNGAATLDLDTTILYSDDTGEGTAIVTGNWTGPSDEAPSEGTFLREFGFWGAEEFASGMEDYGYSTTDTVDVEVNGKLVQTVDSNTNNSQGNGTEGASTSDRDTKTIIIAAIALCLMGTVIVMAIAFLWETRRRRKRKEQENYHDMSMQKEDEEDEDDQSINENDIREPPVTRIPPELLNSGAPQTEFTPPRRFGDSAPVPISPITALSLGTGASLGGDFTYTSAVGYGDMPSVGPSTEGGESLFTTGGNSTLLPPPAIVTPKYDPSRLDNLIHRSIEDLEQQQQGQHQHSINVSALRPPSDAGGDDDNDDDNVANSQDFAELVGEPSLQQQPEKKKQVKIRSDAIANKVNKKHAAHRRQGTGAIMSNWAARTKALIYGGPKDDNVVVLDEPPSKTGGTVA